MFVVGIRQKAKFFVGKATEHLYGVVSILLGSNPNGVDFFNKNIINIKRL